MGLAISRRLANLLEIPLTFASRPGKGSVFAIELPRAEGAVTPASTEAAASMSLGVADLNGAFVVIVDDDPQMLEAMQSGLAALGCEVLAAALTAEVLELLGKAERPPDVLLCDYQLGDKDLGLDAVTAIRDEFATDIPAIIITGVTGPEPLARIAASGLPVLHKPLQWEQLKQAVAQYYARQ